MSARPRTRTRTSAARRPRALLAAAAAGLVLAAGAAGVAIGSGEDPPPASARTSAPAARVWALDWRSDDAGIRFSGPSLADVVTVSGSRCPGSHPRRIGSASGSTTTQVDGGALRRRHARAVICAR